MSHLARTSTVHGKPRSPASIKSIRSSLRGFFRWLALTERLPTDLMADIPAPKVPKKLKQTLRPADLDRLVVQIKYASRNVLRDLSLFRFMLDTGARASEICNLKVEDIDWSERTAKITGKGRKDRYLFFSPGVAEAMRRYQAEERGDGAHFFLSERGGPITPSGLLSLCRRMGGPTGVHIHPHKFRHSFAITYLREGGDVFSLQKRLGHTTLAMSEHYAQHLTDDLRREHDEHSPDKAFFRKR